MSETVILLNGPSSSGKSTLAHSLKETAKELHIPIIALAQLNRNLMTRLNSSMGRPVLSDLKDSGSIEQDADMVLFIHRPAKLGLSEMGEDYAELIIEKNSPQGELTKECKSSVRYASVLLNGFYF